ncbi:MAG: Prolyl oligopeptidase family protein [Planctomycetes bacterium ADurb.Bin069]|nr:MAG: Prolyl oligopeptidase family protein [Planctomycetes bacterium ADurb.Bin069]
MAGIRGEARRRSVFSALTAGGAVCTMTIEESVERSPPGLMCPMRKSLVLILAGLLGGATALSAMPFRRADANADGTVDVADAVKTLSVLFLGDATAPCRDALDANDDGVVDIADAITTLGFLFAQGKNPPPPFAACGVDPTSDTLTCDAFPPCDYGAGGCEDGMQASGSLYRICMPPAAAYNGRLIIWAHGYQDAGEPIAIPEDQMRFGDYYLPELMTSLGFAFATNSYSKTGLAVRQGVADILDLVEIFKELRGEPLKIYVTGASEGGLITTLLVEGHPAVFTGGLAACGPIGDWEFQMKYFGDGRALFEYFFPGLIPGDPFDPAPDVVASWPARYAGIVQPAVLDPAHRGALEQLARCANLQVDPEDFLGSAEVCVRDFLRYSVVNLTDAAATLGGFPFDNVATRYTGSEDDDALNAGVVRVAADAAALAEIRAGYSTTGALQRPLLTIHTLYDSQVPFEHHVMYTEKCRLQGTEETFHYGFAVERFGHCEFTDEEVLAAFALMLIAGGDAELLESLPDLLSAP